MLKGTAIHKSFGKTEILHGIDIQMSPGTITTIIGPSGCGKSTLLRSLALLDPPTSGEVAVDDLSIKFPRDTPVPTSQVWPQLTVVFQQLFLWPHLTIRGNILLPLRSRAVADAEARVELILQDFGIAGFADRHPNEVSLGQRQLGAIARALALEPRYLLLDEVTSALDVEYVAMILDRLQRLKAAGVAILIVSHLLDFARKSADQVVFIDQGFIVEKGTPEILTKPSTNRLERFLGLVMEAR